MESEKPKISQEFESMLRARALNGSYSVCVSGLTLDVFPYVFPPESPFSKSTSNLYEQFGDLTGKRVLDIGTGTGIQAIQAILAGADSVDAVDLNREAIDCAIHNVSINGLENKIKVWQSNLFENIPKKKYDLIITNLPIVDSQEEDIRLHSLYDPGFIYHDKLFREAVHYLKYDGKINLSHANIQSNGFERLEDVARKYGFTPHIKISLNAIGHEWRIYEFSPMDARGVK